MKGFYFITDQALSRAGLESDVRRAVEAGARIIQYRNKTGTSRELFEEARLLKSVCGAARFIVNDRMDIALAVEADGVHLGQEDLDCREARRILGASRVIGVSIRTVEEALAAERDGADYLGVGPVFATCTKADAGQPCGLEGLQAIRACTRLPLAAIGGIDLKNASAVRRAGADMICAISAVLTAQDLGIEIRKFQEEMTK